MMESHYKKAGTLFSVLECHTELLRVLLEQVAFWEYVLEGEYTQKEEGGTLKCYTVY